MTSLLVNQLSVQSSGAAGRVTITVPITCRGESVTATIRLHIFEGSTLPTHGQLLATYEKENVRFSSGETRDMVFTHNEAERDEKRRDIGVEVLVDGKVVASKEFDDAYTWPLGLDLTQILGLAIAAMMMGMVVPMMEEV